MENDSIDIFKSLMNLNLSRARVLSIERYSAGVRAHFIAEGKTSATEFELTFRDGIEALSFATKYSQIQRMEDIR